MSAPLPRPSLQHIFERVCETFRTPAASMRERHSTPGRHEAQLAFCRLGARAGYGLVPIGMKIARETKWIDAAIWEAGVRFDGDRGFAERCGQIELELTVDMGVAAATPYPLPLDADAPAIAARMLESARAAMQVGVADLQILAAAYLALDAELIALRDAMSTPSRQLSNGI